MAWAIPLGLHDDQIAGTWMGHHVFGSASKLKLLVQLDILRRLLGEVFTQYPDSDYEHQRFRRCYQASLQCFSAPRRYWMFPVMNN